MSCPGDAANENIRWWKKLESGDADRVVLYGDVMSDYKDRMSFDGETGILTIHHVHLNDSGVYWCSAGFGGEHEIHLIVEGKFLQQKFITFAIISQIISTYK